MVYGSTLSLPIYLQLPVYQMLQEYGLEEDALPNRIIQLIELDESRRNALDRSIRNQEKVKRTFDKSTKPRSFHIGDTILLWDKRRDKSCKHGKFNSL